MKTLKSYVVDAFAKEVFHGNPAAVVPLEAWLTTDTMQSIAAEHNLAETVFFVKTGPGQYHIRWFTPVEEMDLCGHATVASAFVIEQFLEPGLGAVEFSSMSGPLGVAIADGIYTLDFPSRPPVETIKHALLLPGMRETPEEVLGSKRDYFLVYEDAEQIRDLDPEYSHLAKLDRIGVIATAAGDEPGVDFVSRFFAPKTGINEDPAGQNEDVCAADLASRRGSVLRVSGRPRQDWRACRALFAERNLHSGVVDQVCGGHLAAGLLDHGDDLAAVVAAMVDDVEEDLVDLLFFVFAADVAPVELFFQARIVLGANPGGEIGPDGGPLLPQGVHAERFPGGMKDGLRLA
jgi:PhzF family phenazine biosynthesis protein